MARRFNLGDDGDMTLGGILQKLDKVLSGVVSVGRGGGVVGIPASVVVGVEALALVAGESPARTYRGELFETGNLETPGFVVAEVEVENVDFVRGQQVEQFEEVGLAGEVAGYIEHHAAVGQVGIVVDGHIVESGRNLLAFQQRKQRLSAVEDSV